MHMGDPEYLLFLRGLRKLDRNHTIHPKTGIIRVTALAVPRAIAKAIEQIYRAGYYQPLLALNKFDTSILDTIFSNVVQIHAFHQNFSGELSLNQENLMGLADVFLDHAVDFEELYVEFCTEHSLGKKEFAYFVIHHRLVWISEVYDPLRSYNYEIMKALRHLFINMDKFDQAFSISVFTHIMAPNPPKKLCNKFADIFAIFLCTVIVKLTR
ncbi:hypothetical protein ACTXT7_010117 [Hymenolepis weldensis]